MKRYSIAFDSMLHTQKWLLWLSFTHLPCVICFSTYRVDCRCHVLKYCKLLLCFLQCSVLFNHSSRLSCHIIFLGKFVYKNQNNANDSIIKSLLLNFMFTTLKLLLCCATMIFTNILIYHILYMIGF